MIVWGAPYRLQPRAALSSRTSTNTDGPPAPREGTLLKVETDFGIGYADLHPWPELGDAPLAAQLQALRAGASTPLLERSLEMAELDARARTEGRSLLANVAAPPSHALLTDLRAIGGADLERLQSEGWTTLKIKIGRDPEREAKALNELASALRGLHLRLDANASLSRESFLLFVDRLMPSVRDAIEFIEDPVPFQVETWSKLSAETGLAFAFDRVSAQDPSAIPGPRGGLLAFPMHGRLDRAMAASLIGPAYSYLILKPALQNLPDLLFRILENEAENEPPSAKLRFVVTSYLDHPLGQAGAMYGALQLKAALGRRVGVCGLASHLAYEPNSYSERLRVSKGCMTGDDGPGLGFGDLLARENWTLL